MSEDRGDLAPGSEAGRKADIVRALLEAADGVNVIVGQVLGEFGVPASVASTVWALAPGTEPPTMREIAARLRCDASTVSLAANKLQDGGLITRSTHPVDGRKRTLILTDYGRELWAELRARLHASGLFARLDPQEQATLLALLTKMNSRESVGRGDPRGSA